MTYNKLISQSYFCSHGFGFIYKSSEISGLHKVVAYSMLDLDQRALIIINQRVATVIYSAIKDKTVQASLDLLLITDFEIIKEVEFAETFKK